MSSAYEVEVENSPARALHRLQRHEQVRIAKAMTALGTDPRPHGCLKMSGMDAAYRIRVGNYRVVYVVDDAARVVTVTRIGHRREIYR